MLMRYEKDEKDRPAMRNGLLDVFVFDCRCYADSL